MAPMELPQIGDQIKFLQSSGYFSQAGRRDRGSNFDYSLRIQTRARRGVRTLDFQLL